MTAPLVVVAGPTASGTTTAASALARAGGLRHYNGPTDGGEQLDRRPAAEELRTWLTTEEVVDDLETERAATLTVLRRVHVTHLPTVVESQALPLLLPPNNAALIVRLTTSAEIRAERLQRNLLPDLTVGEISTILRRKEKAYRLAMLGAWGVDPGAARPGGWRADLVIECLPPRCGDDHACAHATAELVAAAYAVYLLHLNRVPAPQDSGAVQRLRRLLDDQRARVRRCTPQLSSPQRCSETQWKNRLLLELHHPRHSAARPGDQHS